MPNNAPVAQPVARSTDEDASILVSAVFTDPDASDTHTFTIDTTGTIGSVTNNNDGTFSYDPIGQFEQLAAGETATDTFTYTVDDGNGGTSTETVTITITGQNDAPAAFVVAAAAQEDGAAITVIADYSDADTSDSHSFTIETSGTIGSVTNNNDGTFSYDPNGQFEQLAAGETATDTFTYTVDDGNGGTSTETVTVTITGQNDAPVALAVAAATQEDGSSVTISADFSDADTSDTHTFAIDTSGTSGSVTDNGDGTFSYDANGQYDFLAVGETATDTFSYTVDDSNGGTSTETVTVTITGQNDAPVALALAAAAQEDSLAATITANFSDPDTTDSHTFTIDTTGTLGAVTNNNDGTFSYDPNGQFEYLAAGETVTDTFTYTVTDPQGASSTESVTVTVTGQNDAPVVAALSAAAQEDGPTVTVSADFSDADVSNTHAFSVDTTATAGSVTDNGDGTFTYDPNGQFENLAGGETATDTFTYTVDDGNGGTSTETVTITITGQNDAPVALAVAAAALEDGPAITVTAAYSDIDTTDNHTFTIDTTGTLGIVTNNNDGTFSYDPNGQFEQLAAGETATDTFTYTVTDPQGVSSTETVTVTVTGQNDAPVALAVAAAALEDGPAITVTAAYSDIDTTDSHTFTVDTTATLGAVTNNNDGTFTYNANGAFENLAAGETATDTFAYTVDDGNGGTSTETVTITITGQNDAPVALGVAAAAQEDGPAATITANFSDPDASNSHTFTIDTTGTLGIVTNNNDGTFSYDPNGQFEQLAAGETATDTFTYTVTDPQGVSSTETVTVTVTGQNDAPAAVSLTDMTDEDTAIVVTAAYTEIDGSDSHSFSVDTSGTLGTVTNQGDGTFSYDPLGSFDYLEDGQSATDTFSYTVDDGNGGTSTETVTITVTGVNDAPVVLAVGGNADENGTAITVAANYSDAEAADTHVISIDTTGMIGLATDNGDGTFGYNPNGQFEYLAAGETTTDTFSYTVTDNHGASSTEAVTITITGQNDGPVVAAVSGTTDEDTELVIAAEYSDVDLSDTHSFSVDTTGTVGSVTVNGDGTFNYDPRGAFDHLQVGDTATDTFTYTVDDGNGGIATETVTVTINGVNDAPDVDTLSAAAEEDGPSVTVAASFSDVDSSGPYSISIDTTGTLGQVTDNGDGTFTYHANGQFELLNPGMTAQDTFTYTVTDEQGGSTTETVTISVEGQVEPNKLTASDEVISKQLGYMSAMNDFGVVVAGVAFDSSVAPAAGAVYVYTPDGIGYSEVKLVASDGQGSDVFGRSLAVNNNGVVAVGAHLDDDNGADSGSIYIFTPVQGGGYSEVKLTASDGAAGNQFGLRLSINDSGIIVAGAPDSGATTGEPGAVYVYTPDGNGGYTETKLVASDGFNGNYFGFPADINENGTIFVGASAFHSGPTITGSAYLYTPDGQGGYTETRFDSPNPEGGAHFGYSGAVNAHGTVVIGEVGRDAEGFNSGAFYVYEPDGSGNYIIHTITPSDIAEGDLVGREVSINDSGVIVVGADSDDDLGLNSGSAYVFVPVGDGSYNEIKLNAYDGGEYDYFGYSVSINNDGVVSIGAGQHDGSAVDTGAVYTFVPDENGNYVGADGTVYLPGGEPTIQIYGAYHQPDGPATPAKLAAVDGVAGDRLGYSTQANDQGVIVTGARGEDDNGSSAGAIYIFTPDGNGGFKQSKLIASDGAPADSFGYSTAINNAGVIATGAFLDDDYGNESGTVYVYTPTLGGGYEETKLTPSDASAEIRFGIGLSVNESGVIAVGAADLGEIDSAPGAVYVYTPDGNGGYSEVKLTASDETDGNFFGIPANINEDGVIFVGASAFNSGPSATGVAYVYSPDGQGGYTETKFLSPLPEGGDHFGLSGGVASDGTVVVGAVGQNAVGVNSGAVYIYAPDGNDGYTVKQLLPRDLAENDLFGRRVDVNADGVIVVGAEYDDDNGINSGAAYVFVPDGNGGYLEYKLTAFDGATSDLFGFSVDVTENGLVVVGAVTGDGTNADSGAVYTFVPDQNGNYIGPDGEIISPNVANLTEFNVAPIAEDVALSMLEDDSATLVSADFSDSNSGDNHSFGINTSGTFGAVTNNGDSTFAYDPNGQFDYLAAGETATDSFTYTVDDENGGTSTATVTITISGENDAPVASALSGDTDYDSTLAVAADFDDPDTSDTHTISIDTTGTLGSVTDNGDGTFSYDPNGQFDHLAPGESATDTFTYTVDDGNGGTATETVTVTVNGPEPLPTYFPAKLFASDGDNNDRFGQVAVVNDNGVVLAGAHGDDDAGNASGAAYLYTPDGNGGYTQLKLVASDNGITSGYGLSVALNNAGSAVVGAYNKNGTGAVYIYEPDGNGGFNETKLRASDAAASDLFGWSTAINEAGVVAVGAYGDDDNGSASGSVYVYTPDGLGGYVETKLTASDGAASDNFGKFVSVGDNGQILVGSALNDELAADAGAVYVYTPDGNGGYSETKLTASDGATSDQYGTQTAVNANGTIVVGAPFHDGTTANSGAVYVYAPDGNGGYTETKLVALDQFNGDIFGNSVAINDAGIIVVGANSNDDLGADSGAVYVFVPDGNGGYTEFKLTAPDGSGGDNFGGAVSINAAGIVSVGALLGDGTGLNTGAAYTFVPNTAGDYVGYDGTIYKGVPADGSMSNPVNSGNLEAEKLYANDGDNDDRFGLAVAINDNGVVLTGSHGDDDAGNASGAAYLYTPDGNGGYTQLKLVASDNSVTSGYGYSVDLNNAGAAVVGAYNKGTVGAVYVYRPDGQGGFFEAKLQASDAAVSDLFGWSTAINEAGVVAVGAYGDDDNGSASGSVYVYTPDGLGGYVETKLTASDGAASDNFGKFVSVGDNGQILVGSALNDELAADAGAVYVYTPDGNVGYSETKLTASDGATSDQYGTQTAVNANGTIVVGAPFHDGTTANSGAVYVYAPDGNGGYTETKLVALDQFNGDIFGNSVAINDAGIIVVGANSNDDLGSDSGAVYVFVPDGNGGYTEFKLTAPDGSGGDNFGGAVSINAAGIVSVGALLGDGTGLNTGAAYTFVPNVDGNYVGYDGTIYRGVPADGSMSNPVNSGNLEAEKFQANDGDNDDRFGLAVAINDNGVVLTGSHGDDDAGNASGAAYLYTPDGNGGYTQLKLVASDNSVTSGYGYSVDLNNAGAAVVGAYNKGTVGAVYVYRPDGQSGFFEAKLQASDAAASDLFGWSTAINEAGVVAVGAHGDDDNGAASGSVYVYTPDGLGGYVETKLTASDGAASDNFGKFVSVGDNGQILVGAALNDELAADAGAVYVYTPDGNGGYSETKLTASDGAASDQYGTKTAVNANGTIVVGAPFHDGTTANSGAVYVYAPDGNGGYTETKLVALDQFNGDIFGNSVAINDAGIIVVGANSNDDLGSDSGAVYVFVPDGNGGYTEFKLTAPDGSGGDNFGGSVSINAAGIVNVGALLGDGTGLNTGAAYTFVPNVDGNYVGYDGTIYRGVPADGSMSNPVNSGNLEAEKFQANDGDNDDRFGLAVAINDNGVVLTGAHGDDDAGNASGAAYLFKPIGPSGYSTEKLVASDNSATSGYGLSVALNNAGAAVVGAYNKGTVGAVYVYRPDGQGGFFEAKLQASDAAASDLFGWSTAINEAGVVAVGAHGDDDNGSASGSVYVYTPDGLGGYVETKLTASDGAASDNFGKFVSVGDNGQILVSAPVEDGVLSDTGAVYVYTPDGNGGYSETKLTASDGATSDQFGTYTAVNATGTIVVGAVLGDDGSAVNTGAVYTFTADGSGGYVETKIVSSDAAVMDNFGGSVAINDTGIIAVGAVGENQNGNSSGAVYVYVPDGNGGYEEYKLTAPDGVAGDHFGTSVSVNAAGIVSVGAMLGDGVTTNSGAVYTFTPDGQGKYRGFDGTVYQVTGPADLIQLGTSADNLLMSGAGSDIFTGNGGNDTFDFTALDIGHDQISDFNAGAGSGDVLHFNSNAVADFASVLAIATDDGTNTVITIDADTSITLDNVLVADLHQDDFSFV